MRPVKPLLVPLAVFLLAGGAPGAIVLFENEDVPIPTNFAGVSVDLETGLATNDLDGLPNADANFFFGGSELSNDADVSAGVPTWQPVRTATGTTDPIASLAFGVDTVGPGSTYAANTAIFGSSGDVSSHFPPFTAGQPGYVGFSMSPNAGGAPLYGWMLVTLEDDGVTPGMIHSWAYDDTGGSILVGQVPEPSSGLLALLSLSLLLMRRRR